MAGRLPTWAMIALAVVSAVTLVLFAVETTTNPVLWAFVVAFVALMAWDIWRHVGHLAARGALDRDEVR